MKVPFDQNVPRNLSRHLPRHEVLTAANLGWEELKNGDLLKTAESRGFDVLITCDQSLRYQQNLTGRKIAIVGLSRNNWPSIQPYVAEVADAVDTSAKSRLVYPAQEQARAKAKAKYGGPSLRSG